VSEVVKDLESTETKRTAPSIPRTNDTNQLVALSNGPVWQGGMIER
jgi:hypothetical protein